MNTRDLMVDRQLEPGHWQHASGGWQGHQLLPAASDSFARQEIPDPNDALGQQDLGNTGAHSGVITTNSVM
jgi:hypothetical protein